MHAKSISSSQGELQLKNAKNVSINYVNDALNEKITEKEIECLWNRDTQVYSSAKFSILYKFLKKYLVKKNGALKKKIS